MNGKTFVCSLGILLVLGLPGKAVPVVQKKSDTDVKSDTAPVVEPGFTSIFNGKTLDGWTTLGNKEIFKVNDQGEIEAGNSSGLARLVNQGDHTDFVLRFRVKHNVKQNAEALEKFKSGDGWGVGVLVRTKSTEMSGVLVTTYPSLNAYGFAER